MAGLEQKLKEQKELKGKLELMGAFLPLGKAVVPGTQYTLATRYIDAIAKYADDARKKFGDDPLNEFYTFNAQQFAQTSAKKGEQYTIKDYITASRTLGLAVLDESEIKLLQEYGNEKYLDLVKKLNRKVEDKTITDSEKGILGLLGDLGTSIATSLQEEITKYARSNIYLPTRRKINALELEAKRNPRGEATTKLKALQASWKKVSGGENVGEQYRTSMQSAGIPLYEQAKYREAE